MRLEELRQQTPEGDHCKFLKADPNACVNFPFDILGDPTSGEGSVSRGDPCPANPYFWDSTHQRMSLVEQYLPILLVAQEVSHDLQIGVLPTPDRISPERFAVAVSLLRFQQEQEREAMEEAQREAKIKEMQRRAGS